MMLSTETLRFIEEHLKDDVRALALQAKKQKDVDMQAALVQIAGHQAALHKLPLWSSVKGILYPPHLSLEQCSSEATARYKASLVSGNTFADLTGGFGIDCYFISSSFNSSAYVERQALLCEIARHNFDLLNRNDITVHCADSVSYLEQMEPVDCLFIDPARRDAQGGKRVLISDCEPDVCSLEKLLCGKATEVLVKLSPMLDIVQALKDLPSVVDIHILSVQNECKELLLCLSKESDKKGNVQLHCVNIYPSKTTSFVFSLEEEAQAECTYVSTMDSYLYEPDVSVMKAGGYRCLAHRFGLNKLHPNSHLYTSSILLSDFPGRRFKVDNAYGFSKKELKELSSLKQANITVRNFPSSVADLRKRLKLEDGGNHYLFATTLADGHKALILGTPVR